MNALAYSVYRRVGLLRARMLFDSQRLRAAGGFVINEAGRRMYLDRGDDRAIRLFRHRGVLDSSTAVLWRNLVETFAPTALLDIGANYGEIALSCQYGPQAKRLHLVEANPRVVSHLVRSVNRAASTLPPDTRVLTGAASSRRADLTLYLHDHSGLSSVQRQSDRPVHVQAFRLDEVVALDVEDRLLFKVDVEGHDAEVLRGMDGLLSGRAFVGICEIVNLSDDDIKWVLARFDISLITRDLKLERVVEEAMLIEVARGQSCRREYAKDVVLRPRTALPGTGSAAHRFGPLADLA